jgi:hypothetical protein
MHLIICKVYLCYLMNLVIIYQITHKCFLVSIISNNLLINSLLALVYFNV